jgi:predicted nucleic acid-binding protein
LTEPDGVKLVWRELMMQRGAGPSSWTDAYLAAFARAHSLLLVTFDRGFARWARLDLNLLIPEKPTGSG